MTAVESKEAFPTRGGVWALAADPGISGIVWGEGSGRKNMAAECPDTGRTVF